jgi:predicted O-linked N-acetylglucosamine transferase (SPINDLY family)
VQALSRAQEADRFRDRLQAALFSHRAQRFGEAGAGYRGALAFEPAHPDALHLLGLVSAQAGSAPEAIAFIARAAGINPSFADKLAELGQAALGEGRHDLASTAFAAALRHRPERAEWRYGLASALAGLGETAAAGRALRSAAAFDPGIAHVHYALAGLDAAATGLGLLERALAVQPDFAAAQYNLANRLAALGRSGAADRRFKRALAADPRLVEALNNLAESEKRAGRLRQAVTLHRRAVALAPRNGDLWLNLGAGLQADQQLAEAAACGRRAIALRPGAAEALSNAGTVAQERGLLDLAVHQLRRALAVRPGDAVIWNNLANALTDTGEVVAAYRRAVELDPHYRQAHSNLLFALSYLPGIDCQSLFGEYRAWADRHARPAYARIRPHENDRDPDRPLRIGYLSADFRSNPIAYNLIGLIERRDRGRFLAYCYAEVARPDGMTERWRRAADGFRFTVGLGDEAVAERIRSDRIDILVCLGGHTANNRVLVCAYKPAPVQMSYGDLSTTGLDTVDYWLTDANVHPPDTRERFTERLLRLPILVIHEPPEEAPAVGPLPALAAGRVTFGSFNNLAKLNAEVLSLWAEVMAAVPGSRLILKYVNWLDNASVRERLRSAFARAGIEPERLILAGERLSRRRHLELLNQVDIALDPFPFNGCTTSFEALWMGVPVVTLEGERWLGRMGYATLAPLGLGDLAAADRAGYVALASRLAADLPGLAALRQGLRRRVADSPLCDTPAYARAVEAAYREAWQRWAGKGGMQKYPGIGA